MKRTSESPRAVAAPTLRRCAVGDAVSFLLFLAVWLVLQTWLLPKLGVPT